MKSENKKIHELRLYGRMATNMILFADTFIVSFVLSMLLNILSTETSFTFVLYDVVMMR